jgi:predicted transcriptional regulator
LDAADRVELERLSAKVDRSLAWFVREALREYLAKTRKQADGRGIRAD